MPRALRVRSASDMASSPHRRYCDAVLSRKPDQAQTLVPLLRLDRQVMLRDDRGVSDVDPVRLTVLGLAANFTVARRNAPQLPDWLRLCRALLAAGADPQAQVPGQDVDSDPWLLSLQADCLPLLEVLLRAGHPPPAARHAQHHRLATDLGRRWLDRHHALKGYAQMDQRTAAALAPAAIAVRL